MLLHGQGGCRVRVDDSDHAIVDARTWRGAVIEYGICVIDTDLICWWAGEDGVYRLETRKEADQVHTSVFIWYARVLVLRASNAVVGRVELVL